MAYNFNITEESVEIEVKRAILTESLSLHSSISAFYTAMEMPCLRRDQEIRCCYAFNQLPLKPGSSFPLSCQIFHLVLSVIETDGNHTRSSQHGRSHCQPLLLITAVLSSCICSSIKKKSIFILHYNT